MEVAVGTPSFSNLKLKYLCEYEKVRYTVFVCSYGAQVEAFKQKNWQKFLRTATLMCVSMAD